MQRKEVVPLLFGMLPNTIQNPADLAGPGDKHQQISGNPIPGECLNGGNHLIGQGALLPWWLVFDLDGKGAAFAA